MLSLVIPVYNESANIATTLDAIERCVDVASEVVIVYDFDEDDTLPVVRQRIGNFKYPIRLQRNAYGRGALNAVKTGLELSASHVAVAVVMADLSDDISDLNKMYALIESDRYDLVCGSRYMRGGRQLGGPLLKAFMSRIAGLSLHIFAGVATLDATNNFKMYRGSFLSATPIESQAGFEIGLELCVKAHVGGYRIGEVPTTWRNRLAGESRFQLWRWLPQYLKWYFFAYRPKAKSAASAGSMR